MGLVVSKRDVGSLLAPSPLTNDVLDVETEFADDAVDSLFAPPMTLRDVDDRYQVLFRHDQACGMGPLANVAVLRTVVRCVRVAVSGRQP